MAEYHSIWRSNLFRVQDPDTFRRAMATFGDLLTLAEHPSPDGPLFAIIQGASSTAGVPSQFPEESDPDVAFTDRLAMYLEPGEVAILWEIGHADHAMLDGYAVAIRSDGAHLGMGLSDINLEVQHQWGMSPRGILPLPNSPRG